MKNNNTFLFIKVLVMSLLFIESSFWNLYSRNKKNQKESSIPTLKDKSLKYALSALFVFVSIGLFAQTPNGTLTVVSSGGDAIGTTWSYSSNTIVASSNANINSSVLESYLSSGNLKIVGTTVTVSNPLTSSSVYNLELKSSGNIVINSNITRTGTGDLILRATSGVVNGTGTLILGGSTTLSLAHGTSLYNNIQLSSNATVNFATLELDYLVVGAGGAGGSTYTGSAGGGGGGRVLYGYDLFVNPSNGLAVTVGHGGAPRTPAESYSSGYDGNKSYFYYNGSSKIEALGGGGGANAHVYNTTQGQGSTTGWTGGGGSVHAGTRSLGSTGVGGSSYKGGDAYAHSSQSDPQAAGGGGGAGGAGGNAVSSIAGNGGIGRLSSITGTNAYYGGGGGGGKRTSTGSAGSGGSGGGGAGGKTAGGSNGTANTGGGGGGAGSDISKNGGYGGSGIVVVRYSGPDATLNTEGVESTISVGGYNYRVHKFLSTDTSVSFNNLQASILGSISGSGNIDLNPGNGTLTVSGNNSYTGTTSISGGGILKTNNANALGVNSNVTLATTTGTRLDLLQNLSVGSISGGLNTNSQINLGAYKLTTGASNLSTTFAGRIYGTSGQIEKTGTSTLTLTYNNIYTGVTTISDGTLVLQNNAPVITSSGYNGTGKLIIEPYSDSFSSAYTLGSSTISLSSSLSGFTLGKSTNIANIVLDYDLSVKGPITIYGGQISSTANITITTLSDTNILMKATDFIASTGVISSTLGKTNVVLWADSDDSGAGYIYLTGAINTNGGGVWLGGSYLDDGNSVGGSTTWQPYEGASLITVGDGYAKGIEIKYGVQHADIITSGGNVTIKGEGAATSSSYWASGYFNEGATISTGIGNVTIEGKVEDDYTNISSNIVGRGVQLRGNALISTTDGDITITGTLLNTHAGGWYNGIFVYNAIVQTAPSDPTKGNIILSGTANGSNADNGIEFYSGSTTNKVVSNGDGNITITGNSISNSSNGIDGKVTIGYDGVNAYTGNITLNGDRIDFSELSLAGSGSLVVQPVDTSFESALIFDSSSLGSTFKSVTIGSATNTSDVSVIDSITSNGLISVYGNDVGLGVETIPTTDTGYKDVSSAYYLKLADGTTNVNLEQGKSYYLTIQLWDSWDTERMYVYLGSTSNKIAEIVRLIGGATSFANINSTIVNSTEFITDEAALGGNSTGWSDRFVRLKITPSSTINGPLLINDNLNEGASNESWRITADALVEVSNNVTLSNSLLGSDILIKAKGDITTSSNLSVQTNNGAIVFWSDSDGNSDGAILIDDNPSFNSANGSTASNLTGGGNIILAGGTITDSNGNPTGNAQSSVSSGVKLNFFNTATATFYSGGGDVRIYGKSTSPSTYNYTNEIGLYQTGKLLINSGQGLIDINGTSSNYYGINFVESNLNSTTGDSYLNLISAKTTGDAITINGTSSSNYGVVFNYDNPKEVIATGGGNISITGVAGSNYGVFVSNTDVLATDGSITLDGGTRGIRFLADTNYLGSLSGHSTNGSSAADVTLRGDLFTYTTTAPIRTSGAIVIESNATAFSAAQSISGGSISGGPSSVRIGKTTNNVDVTINAAITSAGPISVYANTVYANADLTTTNLNAGINLLAQHSIISTATNPTFTTGTSSITGGAVLFATDTNADGVGMIEFENGLNISTHGGAITLGGGDVNGSSYTRGYSSRPEGIRIDDTFSLLSDGGAISIRGKSYTGSATGLNTAVVSWYAGTKTINSGTGTILIEGVNPGNSSSTSGGYRSGIAFYGNDNASSSMSIISSATVSNAITLIGDSTYGRGILLNTETMKIHATGDGGGITLKGTGGSSQAYNYTLYDDIEILAKSGPINWLSLNDKKTYLDTGVNLWLGSKAGTSVASSTADISFTGYNFDFSGSRPYIATNGTFTFTPATTDFAVDFATTWFTWNQNSHTISGLTLGTESVTKVAYFNSSIDVNGPVTVYGEDIYFNTSISLRNTSQNDPIKLLASDRIYASATTINTDFKTGYGQPTGTGGDIIFSSDRDNTSGGDIYYGGLSIDSNGGDITLGGGDLNASGYTKGSTARTISMYINSLQLDSQGGDVALRGHSTSSNGIYFGAGANGITIDSGDGTILLDGRSNSTSTGNSALYSNNSSTIITSSSTQTTAIQIIGDNSAGVSRGIDLVNPVSIVATGEGGGIDLIGRSGATQTYALNIESSSSKILAKSGTISLTAVPNSSGNGGYLHFSDVVIGSSATSSVTTSTANVVLKSDIFVWPVNPNINTSGTVQIIPHGSSFKNTPFYDTAFRSYLPLSAFDFNGNNETITGLTVGSETTTSNLYVDSTIEVGGPVKFYGGTINAWGTVSSTTSDGINLYAKKHISFDPTGSSPTKFYTQGGDVVLASNVDDATDGESLENGYVQFRHGLTIDTKGGDIIIGGGDNQASGYATGSNNVSYTEGLRIDKGLNLNSGGGKIELRGQSSDTNLSHLSYSGYGNSGVGVYYLNSEGIISSGTGSITINALSRNPDYTTYSSAFVIALNGSNPLTITSSNTTSDAITIDGRSTTSVSHGGNYGIEVEASSPLNIYATGSGGGINLSGSQNSSAAIKWDIVFRSPVNILAKDGPINIIGGANGTSSGRIYLSSSPSFGSKAGTPITSSSSDILIRQDYFDWSTTPPIIATTGSLTIEPLNTSFSQTTVSTSLFTINQNSQVLSGYKLGKEGSTTPLTVNSAISANGIIEYLGGNMTLSNTISSSSDVKLTSSGSVTQSNGITADGLALLGSGNYTLTNTSNSINTIAAGTTTSSIGTLDIINSKALTIGSVNPTGIHSSGEIDIRTLSGNLTLSEDIITTSTSSNAIVLMADSDEVAGNAGDGNIIISGTPTLTTGTGGIVKLYSGIDTSSTGLTDLVGTSNTLYNKDSSSDTSSLTSGKYALYRKSTVNLTVSESSFNLVNNDGGFYEYPKTFTVTATSLQGDVTVAATTGYQISLSESSGYASSLTLTQSSGAVSSTIYAKKVYGSSVTSGTITVSTLGASNHTIALSSVANSVFDFDGSNDYIDTGSNMFGSTVSNFTIEVWIKPVASDFNGSYHAFIGNVTTNVSTRNPTLYLNSGKIHYDNNDGTRYAELTTDAVVTQDQWNHIAWVKEGTIGRLYVNGEQVQVRIASSGTDVYDFPMPATSSLYSNFVFGRSDNYYGGKMDEVRFWNVPLTQTQIKSNANVSLRGNESGLLAYYQFNQGIPGGNNTSISSLIDTTGNHNGSLSTGTLALNGSDSNFVDQGSSLKNLLDAGTISFTETSATTYEVCAAASHTLTSTVNAYGGIGTLSYQWQESSNNSTWTDISGATSAALTTSSISTLTYLRRKVSDEVSTVKYSNSLIVKVLAITTQPSTSEQNLKLNDTASTLSIVHTAVSGASYQWYKNSTASNSGGDAISGATSTSYTPATDLAGEFYYYVVITNNGCSVTSNVSGRVLITNPISQIPAATGTWTNMMVGDNFDPNDDQQAVSDTDIVGNSTNALLQTQRSLYTFDSGTSPDYVYNFRARHGDVSTRGNLGSSFYLGLDLDNDKIADVFVEANTKARTPYVAFHKADLSSAGAGTGPSNTSWLNSSNKTDEELLLTDRNAYIKASNVVDDAYSDNVDLDANGENDTWVEFNFTLQSLKDFANAAWGLTVDGDSAVTLFAFTSTSQTANGDIAGINDKTADLTKTWEQLGVTVTGSLNQISTNALLTPTVTSQTYSSTTLTVVGTWGGDQGGTDSLTVQLNGQTYTFADTELTFDGTTWNLTSTGVLSYASSYTVSATATRDSESKTGTGTITIEDNDSTLSALSFSNMNLSPTFSGGTTTYNMTVSHTVEITTLSATTNSSVASMTINGIAVTNGTEFDYNIPYGTSTVTIVVTAQNGSTTTYNLVITRQIKPLISLLNNDSVTDEEGDTATLVVVLPIQPTSDVTVNLTNNDTTEGSLSVSSLTFTPLNWNVSQTVVVTGIDDTEGSTVRDGAQSYTISSQSTSSQTAYNGVSLDTMTIVNQDADPPGIRVTLSANQVSESATSIQATYALLSTLSPTSSTVTFSLTIDDATEASFSSSGRVTSTLISLTSAQQSATVTVYGVDDTLVDGDQTVTLTAGDVHSDSDTDYDALTANDVAVMTIYNLDNEFVSDLYTDYDSYWSSGVDNISSIKPDADHNLIGVRFADKVYSSGVDDFIIDSETPSYASNALSFGIADNYINLGDIHREYGDITLEAWVNLTAGNSSVGYYEIVSRNFNFRFALKAAGVQQYYPYFAIGDGVRWDVGTQGTTLKEVGGWVHIAATRNATTGIQKIYVNGVEDASALRGNRYDIPLNDLNSADDVVTIGMLQDENGLKTNNFVGELDEVRIWNSVRTASEINANKFVNIDAAEHPDLIGYYKFNQGTANGTNTSITTIEDSSLAQHHGTPNNFTMQNTSSNFTNGMSIGRQNSALHLLGTSNYVDLGDNFDNLTDFTFETWVKPKGSSTHTNQQLFNKAGLFQVGIIDSKFQVAFGDGSTWVGGYINSNTFVTGNVWSHLVVTRAANGEVKLYINGSLVKTATGYDSSGSNTFTAALGSATQQLTSSGNYYEGSMDEVRIWNVVRTPQEIKTYSHRELSGSEDGLLAYYNFNDKVSYGYNVGYTSVTDVTGNGYDGTATNLTLTETTSNYITSRDFFINEPFKALPVSNVATSGSGYARIEPSTGTTPTASFTSTDLALSLTDGTSGLNLGSGLVNVPQLQQEYVIVNTVSSSVEDSIPDLLITQVDEVSISSDQIWFENSSGSVVGNKVSIDFSTIDKQGEWSSKSYAVPGNTAGATTNSPVRVKAMYLSDFGITASDATNIAKLMYLPSGTNDPAFIAYNIGSLQLAEALKINEAPTSYEYASLVSPTFKIQLIDRNLSNVSQSNVPVKVTVISGSATLSGTTEVNTNSNGVAIFTDLKINGSEDVTLEFTSPGMSSVSTVTAFLKSTTVLSDFPDFTKRIDETGVVLTPPTTNNSEGAITYSSATPSVATVDSSTGSVTLLAIGTTVITASQASSLHFTAATITATLTVTGADANLFWSDPITKVTNDPDFVVPIGSTSSTGNFTYSSTSSNVASIDSSTGSITIYQAGTTVLKVTQAATSTHLEDSDEFLLTVTKPNPVISFSDLTKTYNDADFNLSATSSSTGTITYSSSNTSVATISGSTVTIVGAGTSVITASQAATTQYNAGTVTMTLTVLKDDLVISFSDYSKSYGDANFTISASSSSTGAFTYSSNNSSVGTVTGNNVSVIGAGTALLTVTQAADSNYNAGTATSTLTVSKINPTISFNDQTKIYNDSDFNLSATSNSSGSISFSSANSSIISISGTTATIVGAGTVIITASQTSDTNYNSGSVTATFTVNKVTPVVSLSDITKTFNDANFNLSATSSSTGALTYSSSNSSVATISGTTVTIVGAGAAVITVNQVSDSNYSSGTTTATLTVNKATPIISLSDITKTYNDADFNISATSSSSGALTYSSSNSSVATISGTTLSIIGAGTAVITVNQDSDANYNSGSTTATLTILKDDPILLGFNDISKVYNDANFSVSATSSSTGTFSFDSNNYAVATLSGSTVTIIGAGTAIITASQTADANYKAASVTATLTVAKDDPVINISNMTKFFNDADFDLVAISNSSGEFSFSSGTTSVATISGTTVTIVGAGTSVITVNQVSDDNYNSGSATATLTVNKFNPTIIGLNDVVKTYNDADFTLSATSSSTGAITYSSSNTSIVTISGSTVTIVGAGSAIITASQASDSNYNSATATASITVLKDDPIVNLSDIDKTFNDPNFNLSATSSSTGVFSYSSNNTSVATISGATVTIVGAGTAVITVNQVADSNYNAATTTATLSVAKDDPVISISDYTKIYTDSDFNLSATSSSTGSFKYTFEDYSIATVSGTLVSIIGTGSTTIRVSQEADANYNSATATASLVINKADPIIGSFADVTKTYGDADFSLTQPSSTSDGSWTYSASSVSATISGDTVSLNYSGQVVITAYQASTANYNAATTSMTLTINKAIQSITVDPIPTTKALKDFDQIPLAASATSSESVTIAVTPGSAATLSGTTGNYSLVNIGTTGLVTVTYSVPATNRYLSATVSQVMDVVKTAQNISFTVSSPISYEEGLTIDLNASSTSGLSPSFSLVSGPATLSGNTLTVSQTGVIVVKASQAGNSFYNPASDVQRSMVIQPGEVSLSNFNDMESEYLDYLNGAININAPTTITSAENTSFIYSSSNLAVASISSGTYRIVGAGSSVITAQQLAVPNKFNSATISAVLTVRKSTPTISFNIADKTYGDADFEISASSNSPESISYSSSNSSVATISGTTVTIVGAGTTIITATQIEGDNFTSATVTTSLNVLKASTPISFSDSTKTYNDPDFDLSATSSSTGSYTYSSSDTSVVTISGSTVTIVGTGTVVITVNQAEDSNYLAGTATATLIILKDDPVISLANLTKTFNDPNFALNASSNSTGALTYSSSVSSVATISGNTLSIVGTGSSTITVNQASDSNYNAASATAVLTVIKDDPTITISDITKTYNDVDFSLSALANSTGAISYVSSDNSIASISGRTVSIHGAGVVSVTVAIAADANYNAGTTTMSITVLKDDPVINLTSITKTFNDSDFSLSASSSSPYEVSYAISDASVATVSGSLVTIVGAGSAVITASQGVGTNYNAASVTTTLTVLKDDPIINFNDITKTYNDSDFSLSATSSSTGAFSYSSSETAIVSISGNSASIKGAGSVVITVSQLSDSNYNSASTTATITVIKDDPIISFNDIVKTYNDPEYELSASSSNTGTFVFNSSDASVATISGTTLIIVGAGTAELTATQASDSNYNSGSVSATLTVEKDEPMMRLDDISKTFNDPDFSISATSSSTGAISYASSNESVATISGTTVHIVGPGTSIITASQTSDSNYKAASVTATLSVTQDDSSLNLNDIAKVYNDPDFELSATSSSSGTISYSSSNTSIATISGTTVTIVGAGSAVITASQLAYGGYASSSTTATLTVAKANPIIGVFADVTKTYGDADFDLVPPSSNSDGTWSFTESSTLVNINSNSVSIDYAGSVVITAHQKETANYYAATVTMTLTIDKAIQTLSVDPIPNKKPLKDFDEVALGATSSSGEAVTISLAAGSAATLSGTIGNYSLVQISQTGMVSITYSVAETNRYLGASISQSMDVVKVAQSIDFNADSPIKYRENLSLKLNATADSGLTPLFSIVDGPGTSGKASGVASISDNTLYVYQTGVVVIQVSQSGNDYYNPAVPVQKSIVIEPGDVTLSNFTVGPKLDNDPNFEIIAPTSTVSGTIVYSSSNLSVATISGTIVNILNAGTTTITAVQLAIPNKFNSASIRTEFRVGVGDADGDGVFDADDLCPNTTAGVVVDENGCADYQKDTDGDGITDDIDNCITTPNADQKDYDNDGIGDSCDDDDDNDGVNDDQDVFPYDAAEWVDNDLDGIGDNADTDDDNDGQSDIHEILCGSDPLDENDLSLDTDGDLLPNCVDPDDDNDGLTDEYEDSIGTNSLLVDTDNDGVLDPIEVDDHTNPLDACSLEVNHQTEEAGTLAWELADCDGDGLLNINEVGVDSASRSISLVVWDTDNDGIPNYLDVDDDNDGLLTMYELADSNGDGDPSDARNTDGDSLPDYLDIDDDGDGVLTENELSDQNSDGNPIDSEDLDGDGIPNFLDIDDDGDGLLTSYELEIGTDYYNVDTDADGVIDYTELQDLTDPLNGCSLIVEHQTVSSTSAQWDMLDCDGDGVLNAEEGQYGDTDGDGLPNFLDIDDDGDGLNTNFENPDPNGDGYSDDGYDADNDGIVDYLDNNVYTESPTVASDIEVYNALSPNGDGLNDVFTIRNIERYPDNELTIFNRWGKILYQVKGYGQYNRYFTGHSDSGVTVPVGTYYYVLKINENSNQQVFKGFLYVNR